MKHLLFLLPLLGMMTGCSSTDSDERPVDQPNEAIYFPLNNSNEWETKSIEELDWNKDEVAPLLDFLEDRNSKSFIMLHKGRIVIEEYFNGHDASKIWYWASAGKTLTTAVTGIAESEGFLDLEDPVSNYLQPGWTSAPIEKEQLITNKHLLSMTSGLDDSLGDDVSPENLQYKSDAGTRWAYHNVYKELQDVVAAATETSYISYFNAKLRNPLGMSGSYFETGDFNVYYSDTRSMARFGLMVYAGGKWNNQQIIPTDFLEDAINTSQNINQAYGYLWWLNGKTSFLLPQSQMQFPGKLIPTAPDDLYAALGKNDQKIYIVPSRDLVVIRMGESAEGENFALSNFDKDLWELIMAVIGD